MVGQVLSPGDFCIVELSGIVTGSNRFEVQSDGRACYGGLCLNASRVELSGFEATRTAGNS